MLTLRSMSAYSQRLVLAAALLSGCLLSSESQAAPPEFLVNVDAASAPPTRDGFYMQLTAGFGLPQLSFTVNDPGHSNHYDDARSGLSLSGSLLLGVPLRPGLVLGLGGLGALAAVDSSHPTSRDGGQVYLVDVKDPPLQVTGIVGGFVDYYPSPSLGWHVQTLIGYAQLSRQNHYSDEPPGGIGIMAGVGHDWWFGRHWSIGLLGRVSYAHTTLDSEYGSPSYPIAEHDTLVSPSLEASFTFH